MELTYPDAVAIKNALDNVRNFARGMVGGTLDIYNSHGELLGYISLNEHNEWTFKYTRSE